MGENRKKAVQLTSRVQTLENRAVHRLGSERQIAGDHRSIMATCFNGRMPSQPPAPTTTPPPHSSRLGNLRFADGRASFNLDGKPVELAGEKAAPTIHAFQAFYQAAYCAYGKAPEAEQEALAKRAPWWQRLRSWLARWLGPGEEGAGGGGGVGTGSGAAATPKADTKALKASATQSIEPPESGGTPLLRAKASKASPAISKEGDPPLLVAAFADEKGVHLLWNLTPGGKADQIKERTYGFDSPVAERLQDCYGKLSELGYDVVDLKLWQAAPAAQKENAPAVQAAASTNEKRVVRLLEPDSDNPTRIAVEPVNGDLKPIVFTETAKRVAALHAAADPSHPPEDRLTFLACTIGPKATKVTEYGVGQDASNPNLPQAWKEIKLLWPEPTKDPKLPKSEPRPEAKPKPEPGGSEAQLSFPA